MGASPLVEALMVLGVAALPVSELRGAIPLAIVGYGMPPASAFALGVLGNLVPVPLILVLLERLLGLVGRVAPLKGPLDRLLARTRRRFSPAVARLGALALVLIVAVPLPMTGAWTGALVAFLFGVPLSRALLLIALGVLVAGTVVTLGTVGVLQLL